MSLNAELPVVHDLDRDAEGSNQCIEQIPWPWPTDRVEGFIVVTGDISFGQVVYGFRPNIADYQKRNA
jgi:hypothetical protein